MNFIKELFAFIKGRKKYWLLPVILLLLLFAVFMVFVGSSVIAPFIYTVF